MSRIFTALLLILATNFATAEAQWGRRGRWYRGSDYGYGLRVRTGTSYYGGGYGWPYYGGYAYGGYGYGGYGYGYNLGDVIRARGEATRNYAQAQILYQQARSKYIENQKKWLETYRERRRIGEADRRAKAEEKRASFNRYQTWEQTKNPPRLSPDELDPNTGKLNWPTGLQSSEFADQRKELEELFSLRSQSGTTTERTKKIYAKAKEMRIKLLDKVQTLPSRDYIDARRFLERISNEGYYAPN